MATKFNRQSLAPRLIPVASSPKAEASLAFPATERARRISSRVLLGEASCLVIDHEGVAYILRSTRLGKLILTK